MDSPQELQRLSALYQYHNAPEVAPAHGLEYDDTEYPSSDKYPVVREAPSYTYDSSNYKGKFAFESDNRPPRIIFGMKVRTFLVVSLMMIVIIVGAAVGGVVGGQNIRTDQTGEQAGGSIPSLLPAPISTSPTSSLMATYSAATPTYTPLSSCSDDTRYSSSFAPRSSSSNAGLNFTAYCNLANPLAILGSVNISEAYVYSFSDCIDMCAGYNYWNDGQNCTAAVYQPGASRPGNCWVGHVKDVSAGSLASQAGVDVALLDS